MKCCSEIYQKIFLNSKKNTHIHTESMYCRGGNQINKDDITIMEKKTMWNRNFTMVVLGQIILATMFSIQIMSSLQLVVPENLIGKIISCAMCIGMCASPIGQAIYGGLFEVLKEKVYFLFFIAAALTIMIALAMKKAFGNLEKVLKLQADL